MKTETRHHLAAGIFLAIAVLNHRLHLELSVAELCLVAGVLGLSQVSSLIHQVYGAAKGLADGDSQ